MRRILCACVSKHPSEQHQFQSVSDSVYKLIFGDKNDWDIVQLVEDKRLEKITMMQNRLELTLYFCLQ